MWVPWSRGRDGGWGRAKTSGSREALEAVLREQQAHGMDVSGTLLLPDGMHPDDPEAQRYRR